MTGSSTTRAVAPARRRPLAAPKQLAPRMAVPIAILAALSVAAGCVTGRVLEGYPGYPFLRFEVPASADSSFFALQGALADEGLEIDFSERPTGLINTRPLARDGGEMFLSAVVDTAAGGGSSVWVAAYEPVRGGARRINPLDEEAWAALERIVARLSERLGGSAPEGPPPPD